MSKEFLKNSGNMISSKKLIRMARKWQKLAAASRRRISWPRSPVANEGHFVVYTLDGRRFEIPLAYLESEIVRQLLQMAEEEFGVNSNGRITLPCDSSFMEYAISVLQRHVTRDVENALILALGTCHSSLCLEPEQNNQQLLITSY